MWYVCVIFFRNYRQKNPFASIFGKIRYDKIGTLVNAIYKENAVCDSRTDLKQIL